MNGVVSFAGIAAAILASFAFSLVLEWVSLVAVMRLMPARPADPEVGTPAKQAQPAAQRVSRAQISQETLRGMAAHRDAQLRVPVRLRRVVMAQPATPAPSHHRAGAA